MYSYSQQTKRQTLRNQKIKKILVYEADSTSDKYLRYIDLINDSGLIYKRSYYDRTGNSRIEIRYEYDTLNRLVHEEWQQGDTIAFYDYSYQPKNRIKTTVNSFGNVSTNLTQTVFKKDKRIDKYYENHKLRWVKKAVKKDSSLYITSISKWGLFYTSRLKNYYDDQNNLIKSTGKYNKIIYLNLYEYNSFGLKTKSYHFPGISVSKASGKVKHYATTYIFNYEKD